MSDRLKAHQVALYLARQRYEEPAAVKARVRARAVLRSDLEAARQAARDERRKETP